MSDDELIKTTHKQGLHTTGVHLRTKQVNKKHLIILSGYMFAYGISFVLYTTLLVAYFNNMHVIISINDFGEADIEMILLPIVLSISSIGLILLVKNHDNRMLVVK